MSRAQVCKILMFNSPSCLNFVRSSQDYYVYTLIFVGRQRRFPLLWSFYYRLEMMNKSINRSLHDYLTSSMTLLCSRDPYLLIIMGAARRTPVFATLGVFTPGFFIPRVLRSGSIVYVKRKMHQRFWEVGLIGVSLVCLLSFIQVSFFSFKLELVCLKISRFWDSNRPDLLKMDDRCMIDGW